MRGTAKSDHTFWSKPGDTDGAWIDDLATDDAGDAHVLGDLATVDHTESDRVFHELRDIAHATGTAGDDALGGQDDPDDALPPAAATAFDINAVTDDLLPSWNLDLG